jgi:hypothetical protein
MNTYPTKFFFRATRALLCIALVAVLAVTSASGQSFSLDDNPFAPLIGPPGIGFGAENPFGLAAAGYPPGLAPSPSLPLIGPTGDGAILSPGPVVQHPGPDGFYVASLSSNKSPVTPQSNTFLDLLFSIDRTSAGLPGTASLAEAALSQAPGDIYRTTASFIHPGFFAGTLVSVGAPVPTYAGVLPAGPGIGSNTLYINQGLPGVGVPGLGLMTNPPGGPPLILPSGVLAPPITPGSHDNVDGFDTATFNTGFPPDVLFDINTYFTVYPAEAVVVGVSASDVFLAAAGTPVAVPVPWAPAGALGMDSLGPHPGAGTPFSDNVDALIVWDNGIPGVLEPVIDYALFGLAPGSLSLITMPGAINDADVFFTDFTGLFALYATAAELGLAGDPAGSLPRPWPPIPGPFDGVDALDIVPEPASPILAALGAIAVAAVSHRRRKARS